TGVLTINGNEYVGYYSSGSFAQSGGTQTIGTPATHQNLFLGYTPALGALQPGATGFYAMSGTGSLTVNGSAFVGGSDVASGGSGSISVSGGALAVTGT